MNHLAITQMIQELREATRVARTNKSLIVLIPLIDLEAMLDVAEPAVESNAQQQRGIKALDSVAQASRFDGLDESELVEIPEGLWESLNEEEIATKPNHTAPERDARTTDPSPAHESTDREMLGMLHSMIAEICIELGDDPRQVPCDIWRVREHVMALRLGHQPAGAGKDFVRDVENTLKALKP